MLEIKGLNVSYNGTQVLNNINLKLEKGQFLSLIGESGAGKTTLGLSIMGLVEGSCSGTVLFNDRDLLSMKEEERRGLRGLKLAMVFQNVENTMHPLYTIQDQIMEAMLVHGAGDKHKALARVAEILALVKMDGDRAARYPHQLSGGERQRALIAMALVNDPEVLILDEPTASLDAFTKNEIVQLLKEIARDKIILLITHDIAVAAELSNQMAVLYAGRIIETGGTDQLLTNPRHPYTRGLLRSYPGMDTTKDLQGIPGRMAHNVTGCPFHPRCTQRIDICALKVPELTDNGQGMIACHRGGIIPVLEVKKLSKNFGSFKAVDDVQLTLYEGETLALVGESGSGKTTLAKTVLGLLKADAGEIFYDLEKVNARDAKFHRQVQMIFQNPRESISHRMNVFQAVKEPLDIHRLGSEEEKLALVREALEDVELPSDDNFLAKYPHHLSGGENQRVSIARALVMNPRVLVADEPTSALDASVQAKIIKLLLHLQEKKGLAILLITHDLALARKASDRMAVMLAGRIVEEGPTGRVLAVPRHTFTQSLLQNSRGGQLCLS
ncbi:ABC transporter ATP-binding protein [Desulfoscipio gibsoniae]|uniref:Oligopeptide/dipeptide ABC transporter, ATP-binding protein n=1 Tax=Desulfoscipio gibsoniae DSM 7213 TaxID=767817 RepID=R4KCZ5_9FIRM|nr:ABC transporter ATP-binding protein [Desulfoscipio gibsoniae]AGL00464.1 oligopeptide/dipeptide ABC transporter, ATP-binding protein [Desulfoscipio gibsoniae DSM 7213]